MIDAIGYKRAYCHRPHISAVLKWPLLISDFDLNSVIGERQCFPGKEHMKGESAGPMQEASNANSLATRVPLTS